jgi:uracil-DNA glycosylase
MKPLSQIHKELQNCKACPNMCGTPVHGKDNLTSIMLIGQAPGPHEASRGKPFAHTAGKTLFQWLNQATKMDEEKLREDIYFAAVARCFPGKNPKGSGDREPDATEIKNCRKFLVEEVEVLRPKLILAVGKLAIKEVLGPAIFSKTAPLTDVIGKKFFVNYLGHPVYVIPLPHPSGISSWHKKSPGKELLGEALKQLTQYTEKIYLQGK